MDEFNRIHKALWSGQISRRDFMLRASALGVSASLLQFALAAPANAAAKRGGTLRLGISGGSTTDTMDPVISNAPVPNTCMYMTYGFLVELDRKKKAVPELAESWDVKPGAKEWTFHIRKGVEFHNSKTLDADDVVYSLNRNRGTGTKSLGAGYMRTVADIKATDKNTVTISLTEGNVDLPLILASYYFGIVPKNFEDWANPIGTGPYAIRRMTPGVQITGERHANYWKRDSAWANSVEITVINDPTARLNALLTGKTDVMNRVDRRTISLLDKAPQVKVVRSPGGLHYVWAMDCKLKEFQDNNVRLALKYAYDREQLLKNVLQGLGKIGNDHPVASTDPNFNTQLPQRTYDPDKAKFHLKQAGLSTFKIPLSTSTQLFDEAVDAAVLYAQSAKRAGIEIEVVREPADGYMSNIWMKKPFFGSYWSGEPTTNIMFSRAWKSDSTSNESRWANATFDKILVEARTELDEKRRRDMYWRLQELANDDGGEIVPAFADFNDATRSNVGGFEPNAIRELDGFRVAERAWLES